jgi:hypothetical protein
LKTLRAIFQSCTTNLKSLRCVYVRLITLGEPCPFFSAAVRGGIWTPKSGEYIVNGTFLRSLFPLFSFLRVFVFRVEQVLAGDEVNEWCNWQLPALPSNDGWEITEAEASDSREHQMSTVRQSKVSAGWIARASCGNASATLPVSGLSDEIFITEESINRSSPFLWTHSFRPILRQGAVD